MTHPRRLVAALAMVLTASGASVAQSGGGPSTEQAVLARGVAAVTAMADHLEQFAAGAIDPETAELRLLERNAELDLHLLAWRLASAEGRAAAREILAGDIAAAELRLAAAEAAFDAIEHPPAPVVEALRAAPTLADFVVSPDGG